MRKMRNVRTGAVAAYDQELVETGRWEELLEKPETGKPTKKSIRVADVKATGSLEVQAAQDAGQER